MAQATEVVFLPLKKEIDTQGGRFHSALETILKAGKAQRLYGGHQVEHPNVYTAFIDWSSIEEHMEFTKQEIYPAFLNDAKDMCDGPLSLYHVHFEPFPPSVAFSEATEFITAYFPADYSSEDQQTFHDSMKKFGAIVKSAWEGCRGSVGGWVAEELEDPKTSEKAKAYIALIGWQSVQSHMDFRETQSFKDNIHVLRGAKDLKNVAVVHVEAKEFKA